MEENLFNLAIDTGWALEHPFKPIIALKNLRSPANKAHKAKPTPK
jgi:hypothetical protein